jgi:multiple antibiotic resistance protein
MASQPQRDRGTDAVTDASTGLLTFALVTFSGIFFVVDPFAVIPLFLSMTHGDSPEKKRAAAWKASFVGTVTMLVFALAGGFIFKLFGITIGAFKIAGGLLLLLLALDMMRAQRSRVRASPEEESEGIEKEDVAVTPLGIPMLAGPGSIAMVSVLMGQAWGSPVRVGVVIASILVTGALTLVLLRASRLVERTLKQTGLNILNRLMGLILAAVAVQFMVDGIADVAPQIAGRLAP